MKKDGITRRSFLKTAGAAALAGTVGLPKAARAGVSSYATLIDLSLCDGCRDTASPACVTACREKNAGTVPDPVDPMPKPFPSGLIEDWSKKKEVSDRLTPYNYLFVQNAEVNVGGEKKTISIPRRCMHCDNPACATICPFSANHKHASGAVVIDQNVCFGGAKCKAVCPWAIPQRQSGVGIYLHILPTLAGNGVMFKCDLCQDRLMEGKQPVCVDACPNNAMLFGPREEILKEAHTRASRMNGFVYGEKENGGTSTLYVSPVSFEEIDKAIRKGPGMPHLGPAKRAMAGTDGAGRAVLLSPVIAVAAGVIAAVRLRKDSGEGGDTRE